VSHVKRFCNRLRPDNGQHVDVYFYFFLTDGDDGGRNGYERDTKITRTCTHGFRKHLIRRACTTRDKNVRPVSDCTTTDTPMINARWVLQHQYEICVT